MRLPEPFHLQGEHIGIELAGARALFTTRRGGHSRGPYASLNLGLFTDDDPQRVRRNRDQLARDLGVGFVFGRQVHGADVHVAVAPTTSSAGILEADGQASAVSNVAPLVLTADCLPIAIAGEGAVAMLHAGWRGLAAGVIARGIAVLRELGGGGPQAAAIGPGAGVCCYETGEEVHAALRAACPDGAERPPRSGANADLKLVARRQLEAAGVPQIHDVGLCTICCEAFFSHRREQGVTGRQAGIAWLS